MMNFYIVYIVIVTKNKDKDNTTYHIVWNCQNIFLLLEKNIKLQ